MESVSRSSGHSFLPPDAFLLRTLQVLLGLSPPRLMDAAHCMPPGLAALSSRAPSSPSPLLAQVGSGPVCYSLAARAPCTHGHWSPNVKVTHAGWIGSNPRIPSRDGNPKQPAPERGCMPYTTAVR